MFYRNLSIELLTVHQDLYEVKRVEGGVEFRTTTVVQLFEIQTTLGNEDVVQQTQKNPFLLTALEMENTLQRVRRQTVHCKM